jgi:hypothetical protein
MVYKFQDFLNESSDSITFIDAAVLTLKENGNKPMSAKEIWDYISKNDIIISKGKTPWITLNTVMSRFSKNTKLDLTLQNRNPDKIEIFEITQRNPLKFILLDENYAETTVKNDSEIENYVQSQEEEKIEKIKIFAKNPFRQSVCVLGDPGAGKSVTVRNILRSEGHKFQIWEPTAATTGLLSQFSPSQSGYIPSKIGKMIIAASQDPESLYTFVLDEFHKSSVIEMVNDELKHAISLRRYEGDRFISLEDSTAYLEEYLDEDDGGNLKVPDNFGFIFISSKPRVIANNGDIFDRIDLVILKHWEEEKIKSVAELLSKVLSLEEKRKLASTRND